MKWWHVGNTDPRAKMMLRYASIGPWLAGAFTRLLIQGAWILVFDVVVWGVTFAVCYYPVRGLGYEEFRRRVKWPRAVWTVGVLSVIAFGANHLLWRDVWTGEPGHVSTFALIWPSPYVYILFLFTRKDLEAMEFDD